MKKIRIYNNRAVRHAFLWKLSKIWYHYSKEYEGYGGIVLGIIFGIVIGITITSAINLRKKSEEKDYSELIKRCFEEANKDLSNTGKKKHSN